MSHEREIVLQPGQHTNVAAAATQHGYLYCIDGSAHLATSQMGIGWTMHGGDGCLLRSPQRYRIFARTAARLLLKINDKTTTQTIAVNL